MELLFMGTAAAEGAPALFCECEHCKFARKHGGREIRSREGALLDGVLKLDFGPDSFRQMLDNNIDYTHLRELLVTHAHEDHFAVSDIAYRRRGFGQIRDGVPPLTVYGNERVGAMMEQHLSDRLAYRRVKAFESMEIEGYTVTPLEAVHCISTAPDAGWKVIFECREYLRSEETFIYLIEKDGVSLLYAHDTDELTPADMEFLAGRKLDLVTMDCTNGVLDANYVGHMGINDNLRMREKLLKSGAADDKTVFVANHFSHNGLAAYEELERRLPGFIVAYDGLRVQFGGRR